MTDTNFWSYSLDKTDVETVIRSGLAKMVHATLEILLLLFEPIKWKLQCMFFHVRFKNIPAKYRAWLHSNKIRTLLYNKNPVNHHE